MRKNLVLLLALSFFFGENAFAEIQFEDALGRAIAFENKQIPVQRVVSLSPGATEILFAVGAGGKVAGRTEFCDYPKEAASVPTVGGFSGSTVSVERIAALKPDLIILSADMHQRLIPLLEGLRLKTFAVEPRNFDEVYHTLETIGELTGCETGAARVASEMKTKIDRARVRSGRNPTVFWALSLSPLLTAGGNTFVNEAVRLAGGRNIFGDTKSGWFQVSFEQVFQRNPDWILSGSDCPMEKLNPLWGEMAAVKRGRIAHIDADSIYRYGPRLADAVVFIADILRKE